MVHCYGFVIFACFLSFYVTYVRCSDNGLALTPPMGWMHWQRFRCITDCVNYPNDCVSEKLFREMADKMVEDNYLALGYEYIIVDDCWFARERDADGILQADPDRFPNGMKALGDYIHSKGLKFGIYEDYGTYTCGGYPGSLGHLETDAKTFAEWGVDYVKMDACYSEMEGRIEGYRDFARYMNESGRPIAFSCSWPAYEESQGIESNYTAAIEICNLWRNYGDIDDSWGSVTSILDWFSANQDRLAAFAGPGHWNDPDMLIIGNYGLSYQQSKAQMAIWSVMAAPLIMSVDFRTIEPKFRDILLNERAIGINQDTLGIQGKKILTVNNIEFWTKPILPVYDDEFYTYGIGIMSRRSDGYPYLVKVSLDDLQMNNPGGYKIEDVFEDATSEIPTYVPSGGSLVLKVKPSGGVLLIAHPVID